MNNLLSKLKQADKKFIFLVVGIILLVEAIWAWQSLGLNITQIKALILRSNVPSTANAPVVSPKNQITSIILSAPKKNIKVGEEVVVAINLSSEKYTDGTDLVISYNPKLLSVILNKQTQSPVSVGSLYNEYPLNELDEKEGKITVSGISSSSTGTLAKGVFGAITFQAKAPGTAKIALDYTPGSTIDSNVIENKTAKDVLNKVEDLELNIMP